MNRNLKKVLIKIHQYLGFFLCIFFVMWFISGMFMMYVNFPEITDQQKLAANKNMIGSRFLLPSEVLQKHHITSCPSTYTLEMLLDRPVYRWTSKDQLITIFADNGTKLKSIEILLAKKIALQFVKKDVDVASVETLFQLDQWIPREKFMKYMPIYKVHMNDDSKTTIYVSSVNGEVVQMHTLKQRILSWLGPIPHWIYPKDLIIRRPLWRQVVIWVSSMGCLLCLSGITIGFMRLKKQNGAYRSPYKRGWFRWHHYTGFCFGILAFSWVFSGLLSMHPFQWSPSTSISAAESHVWHGEANLFRNSILPIARVLELYKAKQIQLLHLAGKPFYLVLDDECKTILIDASQLSIYARKMLPSEKLLHVKRFHPGIAYEWKMLFEEDEYYYSKNRNKSFPVLLVKFKDPSKSWYYIDPRTASIPLKMEKISRINRWVYHGLHSMDFRNFFHYRPWWDLVVLIFLLFGLSVSFTGLILTVKKL
jgi:hypothetical protein